MHNHGFGGPNPDQRVQSILSGEDPQFANLYNDYGYLFNGSNNKKTTYSSSGSSLRGITKIEVFLAVIGAIAIVNGIIFAIAFH